MRRRTVYVSTGNAYADPPQPLTDAIIAMDIDTGKVKWSYQATANDNWLGGCGARNGEIPAALKRKARISISRPRPCSRLSATVNFS
jgi:outer membrane protein assembly factor BamB